MPAAILRQDRGFNRAARRSFAAEILRHLRTKKFSQDTVTNLTRTDWNVLHQLVHLEAYSLEQQPNKTPVLQPRQTWIAEKVGVARETVCRSVKHLASLGVIVKQWRRPVRGKYQTCLYFVGGAATWLMGRVLNRLSSHRRRKSVMYTSQKVPTTTSSIGVLGQFLPSFKHSE